MGFTVLNILLSIFDKDRRGAKESKICFSNCKATPQRELEKLLLCIPISSEGVYLEFYGFSLSLRTKLANIQIKDPSLETSYFTNQQIFIECLLYVEHPSRN